MRIPAFLLSGKLGLIKRKGAEICQKQDTPSPRPISHIQKSYDFLFALSTFHLAFTVVENQQKCRILYVDMFQMKQTFSLVLTTLKLGKLGEVSFE